MMNPYCYSITIQKANCPNLLLDAKTLRVGLGKRETFVTVYCGVSSLYDISCRYGITLNEQWKHMSGEAQFKFTTMELPDCLEREIEDKLSENLNTNCTISATYMYWLPLFEKGILENEYGEKVELLCDGSPQDSEICSIADQGSAVSYHTTTRGPLYQFDVLDFLAGEQFRIELLREHFSNMKIGRVFTLNDIYCEVESKGILPSTVHYFIEQNQKFDRILQMSCSTYRYIHA